MNEDVAPVWALKSIIPYFAALLGDEISKFPVSLERSEGGSCKPGKGETSLLEAPFPMHVRLSEGGVGFLFGHGTVPFRQRARRAPHTGAKTSKRDAEA